VEFKVCLKFVERLYSRAPDALEAPFPAVGAAEADTVVKRASDTVAVGGAFV
jgi:hypothetical protein